MKQFDPKKYLDNIDLPTKMEVVRTSIRSSKYPESNTLEAVEKTIEKLEMRGIDITSDYEDWVKIGFAFAHEFGSQGAYLFHRVSKNYPKYDYTKSQKQFEQCLKSKRTGITLGTFFHLAKQAGVELEHQSNPSINTKTVLPHKSKEKEELNEALGEFPEYIFEQLPTFLQQVIPSANNNKERDVLLLGALAVISSSLPNVYGIYDQYTVHPNLFLFITAPASSGKGRVNLCRRLVHTIHSQKRNVTSEDKVQYEIDLATYNEQKKKDKTVVKPSKPPEQMLFIPANSSATGTFQLLADNNGEGLIFETEGDTLAQTFKSDYGNYSDGFRKAFHHEAISYYRRTDSEYVDIPCPKLSTVLTGTPDQVLALMPDSENGLFSRFIFYKMERQKQWRNVFANSQEEGLEITFDRLGQQFNNYYNLLSGYTDGVQISLQKEQAIRFHNFFSKQYDTFLFLQKNGLEASLLRLGLICYRITMILTTLRMLEKGTLANQIQCADQDFEIALSMIKTLLEHTEAVFLYLPQRKFTFARQKNHKELFLDSLPLEFTTQVFKDTANDLKIPIKSAERYIKEFIDKGFLQRIAQGNYKHILKTSKERP